MVVKKKNQLIRRKTKIFYVETLIDRLTQLWVGSKMYKKIVIKNLIIIFLKSTEKQIKKFFEMFDLVKN